MESIVEFPTVITETQKLGDYAKVSFIVPVGNVRRDELEAWAEHMRPIVREALRKANEERVAAWLGRALEEEEEKEKEVLEPVPPLYDARRDTIPVHDPRRDP